MPLPNFSTFFAVQRGVVLKNKLEEPWGLLQVEHQLVPATKKRKVIQLPKPVFGPVSKKRFFMPQVTKHGQNL